MQFKRLGKSLEATLLNVKMESNLSNPMKVSNILFQDSSGQLKGIFEWTHTELYTSVFINEHKSTFFAVYFNILCYYQSVSVMIFAVVSSSKYIFKHQNLLVKINYAESSNILQERKVLKTTNIT